MKKGSINVDVSFPAICIIGNDYSIIKNISDYTICKRDYIPKLLQMEEFLIDSNGFYYRRTGARFLNLINKFGGFSLKFGGFGVCHIEITLEKLPDLSIQTLKQIGNRIIESNDYDATDVNIGDLKPRFDALSQKEMVLQYLFFFTDPSYDSNRSFIIHNS